LLTPEQEMAISRRKTIEESRKPIEPEVVVEETEEVFVETETDEKS
jgi:hypothetical protein